MGESFVDVSYRGLDLGRRLKLRDVRADSGYLEMPLPMPVGTIVSLASDDGVKVEAIVTAIHEQVAGSELVPGMKLAPKLVGDAARWWSTRVDASLPPEPVPVPEAAPEAPLVDDGQRTTVMAAVDLEALGLNTDNKKTQTMDAIDVSLITGRASSQIGIAAGDDDDSETEISIEAGDPDEGESGGEVSGEMPATPSGKVAGNGKGKRRGKGRTSGRAKRPTKG